MDDHARERKKPKRAWLDGVLGFFIMATIFAGSAFVALLPTIVSFWERF